uniref:non-specific serine/threonine protein kinase n=1 Tax=Oryzias latipes TaxID=8090 RepID=A0A3B3HSP1_ORYLA
MLDAALERAEALIRVGVGRSGQRVAVKVLKSGAGFSQHNLLLPGFFLPSSHLSNVPPRASGPATRHPAIVQLADEFKVVGVNGVHICLVLELLGPDLRSWQLCCGNPGLPRPWVKQILSQVLRGLDHLHARCKIIHTDIKPENILLCLQPVTSHGVLSADQAGIPAAPAVVITEP